MWHLLKKTYRVEAAHVAHQHVPVVEPDADVRHVAVHAVVGGPGVDLLHDIIKEDAIIEISILQGVSIIGFECLNPKHKRR